MKNLWQQRQERLKDRLLAKRYERMVMRPLPPEYLEHLKRLSDSGAIPRLRITPSE